MKTGKLLIPMLIGLLLFGLFNYLAFDPIYGGIIDAVIVGIVIAKVIGKNSIKSAFFVIFAYNTIAWIFLFLFTPDGNLVLQSEGRLAVLFYIGFLLLTNFIYSIIGSFGAFVSSNLSN